MIRDVLKRFENFQGFLTHTVEQAEVCAVSPGQKRAVEAAATRTRECLCSLFGTSVQGYPLPVSASSHCDVLVKNS